MGMTLIRKNNISDLMIVIGCSGSLLVAHWLNHLPGKREVVLEAAQFPSIKIIPYIIQIHLRNLVIWLACVNENKTFQIIHVICIVYSLPKTNVIRS